MHTHKKNKSYTNLYSQNKKINEGIPLGVKFLNRIADQTFNWGINMNECLIGFPITTFGNFEKKKCYLNRYYQHQ